MGSKRLDWIDIAKGIAIILVIVGHTVPSKSLSLAARDLLVSHAGVLYSCRVYV